MDSFELHDQIEEILVELGIDAPDETSEAEAARLEVEDETLCVVCELSPHFTNIYNQYLRQRFEMAPGNATFAQVRPDAQRYATLAAAAAAMELASADPEWADRLLDQFPFDRWRMQDAAETMRSLFTD